MSNSLLDTMCVHSNLRLAIFLTAVVLGFSLVGCASTGPISTSYDAEANVTEYESNPITIPGTSMGGNYGSSSSIQVWAEAQCRGQSCKPNRVTLYFQMSGGSSVRMENRAVELVANGQTYGSSRPEQEDVLDTSETASALGIVAVMEMPFEDFRTVAEASELTGSIGSSGFSLSMNQRGPFQALVQQVVNPTPKESRGT